MARRTKEEIEKFLNSLVGDKVNVKCGIYNGQCVSLIKALLEYLGVPDPYKGRGNAKDVGDTLLQENIAENGKGWLTVCVNRSMGGGYGHIWLNLQGKANYEQNGAKALRTTKNTRPISQAQQLVNLDKWIKPKENNMITLQGLNVLCRMYLGVAADERRIKMYVGKKSFDSVKKIFESSNDYKAQVAKTSTGGSVKGHLPSAMRAVFKE